MNLILEDSHKTVLIKGILINVKHVFKAIYEAIFFVMKTDLSKKCIV